MRQRLGIVAAHDARQTLSVKEKEFVEAARAAGAAADQIGADVYDALGAKNVVRRYKSAGAAGGEPFRRSLEEWKSRMQKPE